MTYSNQTERVVSLLQWTLAIREVILQGDQEMLSELVQSPDSIRAIAISQGNGRDAVCEMIVEAAEEIREQRNEGN